MLKQFLLILLITLTTSSCLQTDLSQETTYPPSQPPTPIPKETTPAKHFESQSGQLKPNVLSNQETSNLPYQPHFCATVTASSALHLRDGPTEHAKVLRYLRNGDRVTVLQTGTWWKIQSNNRTGYAHSKYLQKGCP